VALLFKLVDLNLDLPVRIPIEPRRISDLLILLDCDHEYMRNLDPRYFCCTTLSLGVIFMGRSFMCIMPTTYSLQHAVICWVTAKKIQ
jgi:hypothetical protein